MTDNVFHLTAWLVYVLSALALVSGLIVPLTAPSATTTRRVWRGLSLVLLLSPTLVVTEDSMRLVPAFMVFLSGLISGSWVLVFKALTAWLVWSGVVLCVLGLRRNSLSG